MSTRTRKTVLAILLEDTTGKKPGDSASFTEHKSLLDPEEGELKFLGFDATDGYLDIAQPSCLDDIKNDLRLAPRFDAVTITFTPGYDIEMTNELTDLVNAIVETSVPVPKIIFATSIETVKTGLVRMFRKDEATEETSGTEESSSMSDE